VNRNYNSISPTQKSALSPDCGNFARSSKQSDEEEREYSGGCRSKKERRHSSSPPLLLFSAKKDKWNLDKALTMVSSLISLYNLDA
jgi:hypothetical protein